jgi:hypothetical protein
MSCARSGQLKLFHEEVETRQKGKENERRGKDACQPTDSAEVILATDKLLPDLRDLCLIERRGCMRTTSRAIKEATTATALCSTLQRLYSASAAASLPELAVSLAGV